MGKLGPPHDGSLVMRLLMEIDVKMLVGIIVIFFVIVGYSITDSAEQRKKESVEEQITDFRAMAEARCKAKGFASCTAERAAAQNAAEWRKAAKERLEAEKRHEIANMEMRPRELCMDLDVLAFGRCLRRNEEYRRRRSNAIEAKYDTIHEKETKCIEQGFSSCKIKRIAAEEKCKDEGFSGCEEKAAETKCRAEGFSSCAEAVVEARATEARIEAKCKEEGFSSCAKAAEAAAAEVLAATECKKKGFSISFCETECKEKGFLNCEHAAYNAKIEKIAAERAAAEARTAEAKCLELGYSNCAEAIETRAIEAKCKAEGFSSCAEASAEARAAAKEKEMDALMEKYRKKYKLLAESLKVQTYAEFAKDIRAKELDRSFEQESRAIDAKYKKEATRKDF